MYKKYVKRILDIILSLLAIIILSPLLIIISILVLIFMGRPIIFKQARPGYKNKIFNMIKFRTMTNKKDKNGNLLPDNQRLNKFGKFLRSTSLDELPELFDILFGKMSFIGPRPMLVRDMVFFDKEILKRQDVMPGLTGWAQANGRNSLTWDDRFKYDLYYVENLTLLTDIKTIFLTIKTVLSKEGIGEDGGDLSIDYGDYLLKHKRITKKEYDKKQEEANDLLNGIYFRKKEELVSIIMPSYNTDAFISESIESVLNQSYTNWELIIVDDCSNDKTKKVVKKYLKDKRIKYLENKENIGAAISRNKAIKESNGKYIAFLDSDDIWHKDKLLKQIAFMNKNGYDFTYTKYELIDEEYKPLNKIVSGPKKISKTGMYNYCWPGCLTVMYNQNKVGLVQIEDLKKNNDYAIWLKVIKNAKCYLLNENLAKYRIRTGSISRNNKIKLIKHHYILYRYGEHRGIIASSILTLRNLFFGVVKKIFYYKEDKNGKNFENL